MITTIEYRQKVGLSTGSQFAPLILQTYFYIFMNHSLSQIQIKKNSKHDSVDQFNNIVRYVDDILALNNLQKLIKRNRISLMTVLSL